MCVINPAVEGTRPTSAADIRGRAVEDACPPDVRSCARVLTPHSALSPSTQGQHLPEHKEINNGRNAEADA